MLKKILFGLFVFIFFTFLSGCGDNKVELKPENARGVNNSTRNGKIKYVEKNVTLTEGTGEKLCILSGSYGYGYDSNVSKNIAKNIIKYIDFTNQKVKQNEFDVCLQEIREYTKNIPQKDIRNNFFYDLSKNLTDNIREQFLISTNQIMKKGDKKYYLPYYGLTLDFLPSGGDYIRELAFNDIDDISNLNSKLSVLDTYKNYLKQDYLNDARSNLTRIVSENRLHDTGFTVVDLDGDGNSIKNITFVCDGILDRKNPYKKYYYCNTNGKDYLEQYELFDQQCIGYDPCGSYDGAQRRKLTINKSSKDFYIVQYQIIETPSELGELYSSCYSNDHYEECIQNCDKDEKCISECNESRKCIEKIQSKEILDKTIEYNKNKGND